jgi:hypothetical protein
MKERKTLKAIAAAVVLLWAGIAQAGMLVWDGTKWPQTTLSQDYTIDGVAIAMDFGVNLQGDYSLTVSGPHWLTLGPIDCRGYENISLEFARWLNTDEPYYIDCRVEVSNNNIDWTVLWQSEGTEFITDDQWMLMDYGLNSVAEDQPTVYIRWGYGVRNVRVWPFSGWNIDDVVIKGKRP